MPELAVIVPTRGRPDNIRKVISAWDFTNAWDHADLVLVADADDPEIGAYQAVAEETRHPDTGQPLIDLIVIPAWLPMVHKLNAAARDLAGRYFALGFAGDDHLPQTIGWAARYLAVLRELGTGMVYGDDGYQGRKLSTEWAVTSDAVAALGRMVPAPVEHMYSDNSMMSLFGGAKAMRHLPEVRIEHAHPYAGKAETDEQYQRVNHRDQFNRDRSFFSAWQRIGLADDIVKIRELRKGRPDVTEPSSRPKVAGSPPRRVQRAGLKTAQRSGPSTARVSRSVQGPPRHFGNVRAATPEDIMVALADFAAQVPADQEIVELGVFQGRTALQMAWGASLGAGAHVTGIDPWDLPGNVYSPPFTDAESRRWARHWVDTLGYADKIDLIQAFSHQVAERWSSGKGEWSVRPVGLLFVDGDHTKDGAKRDILGWAPHLAPGARIAVDDYGHPDWPGVGEAVDELVAEGVLEPIEIYHDRLAVTRLADDQMGAAGRTLPRREDGTIGDGPTAITSEGVSPPPVCGDACSEAHTYYAAECQQRVPSGPGWTAEDEPDLEPGPNLAQPMPEPGTALPELPAEAYAPDEVPLDTSPLTGEEEREAVTADEAQQVTGVEVATRITELNTVQLRALAKIRGITLGYRKNKRDEILQALRDGR